MYITLVHNPSGGIKFRYTGDYLDGMLFSAAQESYYNRECPVYMYEIDGDGKIIQGRNVYAFFNGENLTERNERINARAMKGIENE